MSKLTIIQLLNKIANGEEKPKKVKYDNQVFEYREDMLDYYCYDYDLKLMGYQKILNEEVEILEEEKKIPEKLNIIYEKNCKNNYKWKCEGYNISTPQKLIADKINSIIDYLKSKEE